MHGYLLALVLVGLMSLELQSAAKSYLCEAPPEIQEALTQAGSGGIDSLLSKYPGNFWVLRSFIDYKGRAIGLPPGTLIPPGPIDETIIARFHRDYNAHPTDPEYAYLYAYSLIHRDTKQSIEILTSIVQATPSFHPAWLTLAILYGYPNWSDSSKTSKYLQGYLSQCPDTTDPRVASMALQLDRSDATIAYAKFLRARIEGKSKEETISQFPSLWSLESKIALPSELEETRKRIETDLQFLEGLDKARFKSLIISLMRGYQKAGHTEAVSRLNKDLSMQSIFSDTRDQVAFARAQLEWASANPFPGLAVTQETQIAYYKKQLELLTEWQGKMPKNSALLLQRFIALSFMPDTTDEKLIQEGGSLMTALRGQGGMSATQTSAFTPASIFDVLSIWANRGLELDRIPLLVQEFTASQTKTSSVASDLYGKDDYQSLSNENQNWTANTSAWPVLVTTCIKKQRLDQVRKLLTEWEKALDERRKRADEIKAKQKERGRASGSPSVANSRINIGENSLITGIASDESRYYAACAQLAAAEEKTLDALAFYQSSLRLISGRSASPGLMEFTAVQEAEKLWKKSGGSEATWIQWLDTIKSKSVRTMNMF
jgi:hypothetical protein